MSVYIKHHNTWLVLYAYTRWKENTRGMLREPLCIHIWYNQPTSPLSRQIYQRITYGHRPKQSYHITIYVIYGCSIYLWYHIVSTVYFLMIHKIKLVDKIRVIIRHGDSKVRVLNIISYIFPKEKIVVFGGHCNAPCWNKYEFVRTKYNGYHI